MPARFADLMMYAVLAGIGGIVIWQSYGLPNPFGGTVGSGGFPIGLSVVMIALSAIGAVRTALAPARPDLEFSGLGKIAITLVAMIAFFGLWQAFGYFFPLAFVFLSGLLCLYAADSTLTARIVVFNIVGSAVVLTLINLFFTYVLYIRF